MRNKKQTPFNAGNVIGTLFFMFCGFIGVIGYAWLDEQTNSKAIEVWGLHEVAGRNDLEETFEAERNGYKKTINDVTWLKNEYYDENKKLTQLISRGGIRKTGPILDYSKLKCKPELTQLMETMCAKHGFPTIATAYCIIQYESRFDPSCHTVTNKENSMGLFQVNVKDASHKKRNPKVNRLFDSAYNMDYQLDELKVYYDKGLKKGLTGADLICYVSRYGQRPTWKQWIADSIHKSYKEYLNAVVKHNIDKIEFIGGLGDG